MKIIRLCTILFSLNSFKMQVRVHEITVCLDHSSKTNHNDTRVIEVTTGSIVHMWCRYCYTNKNYFPRLWFYKPRANVYEKMEELRSNHVAAANIEILLSHTLNIYSFNQNNSGIYTCKSYDESKDDVPFTYVLDGIIYTELTPKMGSTSQWQEYKHAFIDSINNDFKIASIEPYKSFRSQYNCVLNVYTVWDNWSECFQIEGLQKGVRKRLGRCRIRIAPVQFTSVNASPDFLISYLTDGYSVPCRSLKLNESVPEISRITRDIPEFEAEEKCPIFRTAVRSNKSEKQSKLKSTQQVMENSHVTLRCTEVIANSDITWFKDKKLLKSLYGNILNIRGDEPHISIDANNSLHILRISKNEEGNYTCSMNGKRVKMFEVKVISKSKLLNEEFIRYSIYLGFVLSLTMTCYCAGVCVAWHRRSSFLDPLNLHKRPPHLRCEERRLLEH